MKNVLKRLIGSESLNPSTPEERELMNGCAGRVVNAMTFIVMIICLGLWITGFLLAKDSLSSGAIAANLMNALTCLTFFGGLAIALFVGAMIGNFLRRSFWRWLVRRRKS